MEGSSEAVNRAVAVRLGHLFMQARKDRGLSLPQAEEEVRALFGPDAISASNLQRVEWGHIAKPALVDVARLAAFYAIPWSQVVEAVGIRVPGVEEATLSPRKQKLRSLTDRMLRTGREDQLDYPITMLQLLLEHWARGEPTPG